MYKAVLTENSRVLDMFDASAPENSQLTGVVLPDDIFFQVWENGYLGDWVYQDGTFVHDPEPRPITSGKPLYGEIPAAVL